MAPTLTVRLLGEFRIVAGERALAGLDSPRLQSLLARLALHPAAPQPRPRLAALYWPDSPEAQARTNLRRLLHDLRLAWPDADRHLALDGPALAWRADAPPAVDAALFLAAAADAETGDPAALARALALYRG